MKILERLKSLLSDAYSEGFESFCTRVLYFFNTIDSYFLVAGMSSYILVWPAPFRPLRLAAALFAAWGTARIADFYPVFPVLAVAALGALTAAVPLQPSTVLSLVAVNAGIFFAIQFLFMGIPDSIVARDPRVAFIKMVNSLVTVAPTTVSFSMSVFFSSYLSLLLYAAAAGAAPSPWLGAAAAWLLLAAAVTRLSLPTNRPSRFHKPDTPERPPFRRVLMLNIDGARKDVFDALDLPVMRRLAVEGASHPQGLHTVYRALTNPAFASILTGAAPEVHGVMDNNLGRPIRVEGLADVVPSIAYGSMHVKHFCKPQWETRIVSLPRHSIYRSDDVMVSWIKEDLESRPEVRLFVADFSEADFLAHAYGSTSAQYKDALRRIDARIGALIDWMGARGLTDDSAIIVCSDHGIAAIDHSFLIARSERYVPFYLHGKGIRKGFRITRPGRITDICSTIAYLLGVRYPDAARGQVFTDALEECPPGDTREALSLRFNRVKYDSEAGHYDADHPEIGEGDRDFWDGVIARHLDRRSGYSVLDVGCGSGFVGRRLLERRANFEVLLCVDVAPRMLEAARAALGGDPRIRYRGSLEGVEGSFDVITANSIFHHVPRPEEMAARIDSLLAPGGLLVGAHEPNRRIFQNPLFRAAATLYKRAGGGVDLSAATVLDFNRRLRAEFPRAPAVCADEILQTVECHSPLEQWSTAVDAERGFVPPEFFAGYFPGYEVLSVETYTTFHYRPALRGRPSLQRLLARAYRVFFDEGNLFRFVLRKRP